MLQEKKVTNVAKWKPYFAALFPMSHYVSFLKNVSKGDLTTSNIQDLSLHCKSFCQFLKVPWEAFLYFGSILSRLRIGKWFLKKASIIRLWCHASTYSFMLCHFPSFLSFTLLANSYLEDIPREFFSRQGIAHHPGGNMLIWNYVLPHFQNMLPYLKKEVSTPAVYLSKLKSHTRHFWFYSPRINLL